MDLPSFTVRGLARNRELLFKLSVVAIAMFGFGYAMVPMYRTICEALGINVLALADKRSAADPLAASTSPRSNSQVDLSRRVTVEFDANARGPWEFHPEQRHLTVHPGELTTVMYEFKNVQNRTMVAQAIPSYAPRVAESHFDKIECFCFSQHTLAPGESKRWPVVFVVDSKLPKDVSTITLSYTFFEVGGKVPPAPTGGPAGVTS